jgi:hypothetical protein
LPVVPDPDPPSLDGDEILEGAVVVEEPPGDGLMEELARRAAEVVVLRRTLRLSLMLLSDWLMYDVGCAAPPRGPSLALVRGWVQAERAVGSTPAAPAAPAA